MGAAKKIKMVLTDKGISQKELAEMVASDKAFPHEHVRNLLSRDTLRYSTVEEWMDALGVDVVFRDRKTGKLYR